MKTEQKIRKLFVMIYLGLSGYGFFKMNSHKGSLCLVTSAQYKFCILSTLSLEATHSSEMVITTYNSTTCIELKEHKLKLQCQENLKNQVLQKPGKNIQNQRETSHAG